jgi:hypothetical protein
MQSGNSKVKTAHKNSRRGLVILIGLPLLFAGLVLFGRGLDKLYLYFASSNWPQVKADIVSVKLVKSGREGRNATTGIIGSFTYEFNDQKYTSNNIDIVGGQNTDHEGKKARLALLIDKKNRGEKVDMYVNPDKPSYAFIYREISFDMFGYLIIGTISFLMGLFFTRCSRFYPGAKSRSAAKHPQPQG